MSTLHWIEDVEHRLEERSPLFRAERDLLLSLWPLYAMWLGLAVVTTIWELALTDWDGSLEAVFFVGVTALMTALGWAGTRKPAPAVIDLTDSATRQRQIDLDVQAPLPTGDGVGGASVRQRDAAHDRQA